MDDNKRNLTDSDVEAITEALRHKVIKEFYQDLGRGVWGMVWRVIVMALIAIAAYGAAKSIN